MIIVEHLCKRFISSQMIIQLSSAVIWHRKFLRIRIIVLCVMYGLLELSCIICECLLEIGRVRDLMGGFCRISARHPYVANDERRLLEIIRSQKLRFDSDKFKNLSQEGIFILFRLMSIVSL